MIHPKRLGVGGPVHPIIIMSSQRTVTPSIGMQIGSCLSARKVTDLPLAEIDREGNESGPLTRLNDSVLY
jgi:hypothetical protein